MIYRGTTPVLVIAVEGAKVAELGTVYVTLKQDNNSFDVDVTGTDVDENLIYAGPLTQTQTLSLVAGKKVKIQIRDKDTGGTVMAFPVMYDDVGQILKEAEI